MIQILNQQINMFLLFTYKLRPYISFINVSSNGHINKVDGYVHQIVLYLALKYHFT